MVLIAILTRRLAKRLTIKFEKLVQIFTSICGKSRRQSDFINNRNSNCSKVAAFWWYKPSKLGQTVDGEFQMKWKKKKKKKKNIMLRSEKLNVLFFPWNVHRLFFP